MSVSIKAIVDLALGSVTRGRDFSKEITKLTGDATAKGVRQGVIVGTKQTQLKVAQTFSNMLETGFRKGAYVLRDELKAAGQQQLKTANEIADKSSEIEREKDEETRERMKMEREALQMRLKMEQKAQEKLIDRADKATEHRMSLLERARKRRDRSTTESVEAGADKFKTAMEGALTLDTTSASGFAESLMKGLSGAAEAGAGELMAGGAAGTEAGGAAIAGLSVAAGTLAAAAAGIAAVVALFAAAYGQAKDMNKALMEGISAMDLQGVSSDGLAHSLSDLREAATDVAWDFRMSKEDTMGAITAFHEAGITIKEFSGFARNASSDVGRYTQLAATAITASKGLGVGISEIAEFANLMNRDLGAGLDKVQGAFGMIGEQAGKAGMNTKDFFAAINGATSGMALYNFRVADTVGLFTDLVKIIGEDLAKEEIGVKGTYRNMSMQDKYKSRILSGGGRQDKIMAADAKAQARDFGNTFGDRLEKAGLGDMMTGEGDNRTLDLVALSKLQGKEFGDTWTKVAAVDPAAARKLDDMQKLNAGGVTGLGSASKTGELALQLNEGSAMRGGKMLRDMTGMQRAMMEEILGINGEEFDRRAALETGLMAKYEMKGGAAGFDGMEFSEALASGKLVDNEELEAMQEKQYTLMEQTARDSLKETTSISQTLSNGIAIVLDKIYGVLELILTFFPDMAEEGKRANEARIKSLKTEDGLRAAIGSYGDEIKGLQTELKGEKDPEKKLALEKNIAQLQARMEGKKQMVGREKDYRGALQEGKSPEEALKGMYGDLNSNPEMLALAKANGLTKTEDRFTGKMVGFGEHMKPETETVDVMDWTKVSEDNGTFLSELVAKTEEMKKVDADLLALEEKAEKTAEEGFEDVVKALVEQDKQAAMTDLAGASSFADVTAGINKGEWGSVVEALKKGGLTLEERQLLASAGVPTKFWEHEDRVDDFIYRGDGVRGSITPINKMDEFFGAKPGGAIHKGMGGSKTAVININGGNLEEVRRVVTKVLQDTGYSNMKSY